ncbi:MAG: aspartyl-phosphate phosphatase Spo0E family protein [Negativicutes bacterium]|nr:aspartyl-phosphate phosphatase Spo0E family protein [Negativicutes bacterium]
MPDIEEIKARTQEVLTTLWRLTKEQDGICTAALSSGVAVDTQGVAELEDLRHQTETLRRQLQELKTKSRLDPEVLKAERQLDEALSRYYWLWQKCKDNFSDQEH